MAGEYERRWKGSTCAGTKVWDGRVPPRNGEELGVPGEDVRERVQGVGGEAEEKGSVKSFKCCPEVFGLS